MDASTTRVARGGFKGKQLGVLELVQGKVLPAGSEVEVVRSSALFRLIFQRVTSCLRHFQSEIQSESSGTL